MTVLFGCVFGMGEIVAGERERGELARLFMTPTSVTTVIGGKIISKLVQETGRGYNTHCSSYTSIWNYNKWKYDADDSINNPRSFVFYRIWNNGICKGFITRRFYAECNAYYDAYDVCIRCVLPYRNNAMDIPKNSIYFTTNLCEQCIKSCDVKRSRRRRYMDRYSGAPRIHSCVLCY